MDSVANPLEISEEGGTSPDPRLAQSPKRTSGQEMIVRVGPLWLERKLRHTIRRGKYTKIPLDSEPLIVCPQCAYGDCVRCLRGKHGTEEFRWECECPHWWAGLEIGADHAKIEAEETRRREEARLASGDKGSSVRSEGGQATEPDLSTESVD